MAKVAFVHETDETAADPTTLKSRGAQVEIPANTTTLRALMDWASKEFLQSDVLLQMGPGYGWIPTLGWYELYVMANQHHPIPDDYILHIRLAKQPVAGSKEQDEGLHFREQAFTDPYHALNNVSVLHQALTCTLQREGYAPVVGLFQSSGWGKSRTVCELWRENVWVVYCSFSSGSGFPASSAISKWFRDQGDMLLKDASTKGQLMCMNFSLAYFVACFQALADQLKKRADLSKQMFASMMWKGGNEYWAEVQGKIGELMKTYSVNPNLTRVEASMHLTWNIWEKEAASIFSKGVGPLELIPDSEELQVLFVFDEARHLVRDDIHQNLLVPLRRATRAMKGWKSLALLMDTSSEITNFAAPDWPHPSDRVAAGAFMLPPPIWGFFTADISEEESQEVFSLLPPFFRGETVKDIISPFRAVMYGRPLWWATFKSHLHIKPKEESEQQQVIHLRDVKNAFSEAYSLAKDKVLGGSGKWAKHINCAEMLPDHVALGLLGVSVGIDIDPHAKLASNMVAKNLLTVVSVSPARDLVWTAWCPEPLVAKAAGEAIRLLHAGGRCRELYEPLVQALAAGWVDRGETGELVARIILLQAIYEAERDGLCTVDDFCNQLVGKSLLDLIGQPSELQKKLAQARVHFNSFCRVYRKVSELTFDDVCKCIERGLAVMCGLNAWGVDILIFVSMGGDDEKLTVDNVTVIFCQVKIRKQDGSNTCFAKISPKYAGLALGGNLPYLSLYMNVKSKEKAESYVVDSKEIKSTLETSSRAGIKHAREELEIEKASPEPMEIDGGNRKAVQAWRGVLQEDRDLQTVLFVKGFNAFKLDDGLKDELKKIVETSRDPFRTDTHNKLHDDLLGLQKKKLHNMFKVVNIEKL